MGRRSRSIADCRHNHPVVQPQRQQQEFSREDFGWFSVVPGQRPRCVCYRCCARMLVVRGAAVEPCHQVAVGGAGGGKFVVAVLEVLAAVEELLFEFGDAFLEGAGFVGAGEASVVEDLFAEGFGQPLGELGVLVAESFVVCAQVGEVGQE
jgi:hypothetical protein